MNRRLFLQMGLGCVLGQRIVGATEMPNFDTAASILAEAVRSRQIAAAVLHVARRDFRQSAAFGPGVVADSMFLLGSISKPVAVAALMTLSDRGEFSLDDRLQKFLPGFSGTGREQVTIRHLLRHVSGLPDQLPNNAALRSSHAPLSAFVEQAMATALQFEPASRYQYSSMGILLAAHVAERIAGVDILTLIEQTVFKRLEMRRSAQGLGRFRLEDFVPVQTERAAPESGGGDPASRDWDWNSAYWRRLGAPWGGTHASAGDIAVFLREFLEGQGRLVKPETARAMIANQNPAGMTPRGLGFAVGPNAGSVGCSDRVFGHTGSTGTICWADPADESICVVLTSLPATAANPHPRDQAANQIAKS
ncbi:MAG: beta-lactamase family protein [Planctomycetes bacterium]|nr:beta-lactamase family protein [Planctomycetota bacterium]